MDNQARPDQSKLLHEPLYRFVVQMNPSIVQGRGNTAVTIPPFVFVIDGCHFRFSHFVFVHALHPL